MPDVFDYDKILTKGLKSSLNTTPIEDGKLRFTTDTGELFLDQVSGETKIRSKISDIISDYTEEEIAEIIAPLPKVYLSRDTHRMYVFVSGQWIDVGAINLSASASEDSSQVIWFSKTDGEFPTYDNDFSYNSSKKELSVKNIKIGNMKISESVDNEGIHTVNFSF